MRILRMNEAEKKVRVPRVKGVELVLSEDFLDVCQKINKSALTPGGCQFTQKGHVIADAFLAIGKQKSDAGEFTVSMVDVTTKDDVVSFTQPSNIYPLLRKNPVYGSYTRSKNWMEAGGTYDYSTVRQNPWLSGHHHLPPLWDVGEKEVWTKNRGEMGIVRFVSRIAFPEQFPLNVPADRERGGGKPIQSGLDYREKVKSGKIPKAEDVQSFADAFTAVMKVKNDIFSSFAIVGGKDLVKWYNSSNYEPGGGSLHGSCMRSARWLEVYEKNPTSVRMLVMFNKKRDKIQGRALVWNVKTDKGEDRIFLDRVYIIKESDQELFFKYAQREGWLRKSRQTAGNVAMVDGRTEQCVNVTLTAKIRRIAYKDVPYLDTMRTFNINDFTLSNKNQLTGEYTMSSTGGGTGGIPWNRAKDLEKEQKG